MPGTASRITVPLAIHEAASTSEFLHVPTLLAGIPFWKVVNSLVLNIGLRAYTFSVFDGISQSAERSTTRCSFQETFRGRGVGLVARRHFADFTPNTSKNERLPRT